MASTWAQAMHAKPPRRFFGRRLIPFSLYHARVLSELRSPYAYAVTVPASPRDLFVAVLICSRTRQENAGATFSGGGLVGLAAWRMRWRGFNFAVADASFREYIADFTSRARRKAPVSDKESPPLVAPVEFHLHRHLTEDRGWDDDAAWDCPVNYAWALFDVSSEWRQPGILQSAYDEQMTALLVSEADARARGDAEALARIDAAVADLIRANAR